MKNGFRIIDSEPHLEEPFDLWERRLPEPFRSRTKVVPPPEGHLAAGGTRIELDGVPIRRRRSEDGRSLVERRSLRRMSPVPHLVKARTECAPEVYLEGFDVEGVDVGILMPTLTMSVVRYDGLDPQHALAMCRVYNDYAAEFCADHPQRLKFWGWIPPQDAELAAEETRRCSEELGAAGVAMTKGAVDGHLLCDGFFDPLWQEVDRLGVPFGLHGPGGGEMADNVANRYRGHRGMDVVSTALRSPFHAHTAIGELIFGGVLERYPNLKTVHMETGASWLPWLLDRLDEKWEMNQPDLDISLPLSPSEYFRRQCYVVMDPGENVIRYTLDYLGADNLLISTDYPHNDCLFPEAMNTFFALEGISDQDRRKILWDNGARLYGIEVPETAPVTSAR